MPGEAYFGSFGGLCAPTITMTVPTFSAVTSRKFGGSCTGWRGGAGGGLARGKANRPRRRWPIPLPRGVSNSIQPFISQRAQSSRLPEPPMEADMDPIIEKFVHQQNLRRFQASWLKRKTSRVDINFRSYWQRNRRRITATAARPEIAVCSWIPRRPGGRKPFRCSFRDSPSEAAVCATIRNGIGSQCSQPPRKSTTQRRTLPNRRRRPPQSRRK
jgi:hypothetical protein